MHWHNDLGTLCRKAPKQLRIRLAGRMCKFICQAGGVANHFMPQGYAGHT